MENLNKWLVGLDLTQHDESILKYTKLLSTILNPSHIEFMFITHRLADSVHVHLPPDLRYPAYDDILDKLKTEVSEYFSLDDAVSCEVVSGIVQFDLWRESYNKDIDLFIAGSKPKHKGRGLIPKKFVRKSFCSVLFIPEEAPDKISKIWVPIDFSESSGGALSHAVQMAQHFDPPAEVFAHHVYQMPHAYYYEGFPRDEIMRAVKGAAEDKYKAFNEQYNPDNFPVSDYLTHLSKSYAAEDIDREANQQRADLILMAAGGRSKFSKLFLGSETEQMVQREKQLPLMILKEKKNYVKLWDLLNP